MQVIEVGTKWGPLPAHYHERKHDGGSKKLAVLFPGRGYTLDAPLLWYSAEAAFTAGCDVVGVEYGYQANRAVFNFDDLDVLITEVASAVDGIVEGASYSEVVFIGKSIGTMVQAAVANRAPYAVHSHVFLTPLHRGISDIKAASRALVIVGDSDPAFQVEDVSEVSGLRNVDVHVMAGADHGLQTANPLESINILHQTTALCQAFCKLG